ncbi:MAG: hypothetical protein Phog2KO_31020 [Phototrophicaceae bacterium]
MRQTLLLGLLLLLTIPLLAQDTNTESNSMTDSRFYHYTYHQKTGNRFINGQGTFPNVTVDDVQLEASPQWIIGANQDIDAPLLANIFAVQLTNDTIHLWDAETRELTDTNWSQASEQSFVLYPWRGGWTSLDSQNDNLSHPTEIGAYNGMPVVAEVTSTGRLQLAGGLTTGIDLNIQPDARIVLSDDGRIAVYANATNQRYVHGIMGDDIEGASLVVLRINDEQLDIIEQIDLEGDAVYEGLSPMWADINQDGVQDLVTTVSDSQSGSRIRVYLFTENGILTVDGQAIGQSNRWQHQLAWGAFGVNGEMQLVDVLTPHIGGWVRFYEFDGTQLLIQTQLTGYTSHVIGSRNLDMAVAGDFDGDGQPEIVLPSQDRQRIAGIRNSAEGAVVAWELELNGTLVTNLAGLNTPSGLALAVGRDDGTMRVWSSQD